MPALIERPKMTRTMYQALKRHIMKERDRKKQEQEQGALLERIRKETEIRKKKEQETSLTMEQTKEQIQKLETKLESHKQEKHELFNQLKKVLQQEEQARRRATVREHSELMSLQQSYTHPIQGVPGHHPLLIQSVTGRPTLYKPPQQQQHIVPVNVGTTHVQQGTKRPRSQSPTPSGAYKGYEGKYTPQGYPSNQPSQSNIPGVRHEYKQTTYPQTQSGHVTYPNQSGQQYQQAGVYATSQSPARKFTQPGGHSAFSTYPSHYAQHQKHLPDVQPPYQIRMQQPGYMAGGLQQQQPAQAQQQKQAFPEDTYQIQQPHARVMATVALPRQQAPHLTQQIQQSKGTAATGYSTPRGQAPPSSGYATSSSQASFSGQASAVSRGHYSSAQQPTRFY